MIQQPQTVAWSTFGVMRASRSKPLSQPDPELTEVERAAADAHARFLRAIFSVADDVAVNCRRKSTCVALRQLANEFLEARRVARKYRERG